jgi:hypothetical protein
MFGTNHNAGWFESHVNAMRAESAFGGSVCLGVEVNRVVRAGLHTGFASDADAWVKLDDAVIALIHRSDRTDAHAWGIGAMIAARHLKAAAHIRIRARLDILDPRPIHTQWHLILRLARGAACVTADALTLVNQKSIICHRCFHHVDTELRGKTLRLSG